MAGEKSFIWNRCDLWECGGVLKNGSFVDDGIMLAKKAKNDECAYFSKMLDSCETGTVWNKLQMNFKIYKDAKPVISLFAADSIFVEDYHVKSLYASFSGETIEALKDLKIDDIILSKKITVQQRLLLFYELSQLTADNPEDILLYALKGRYLWFCVRMISYENGHMILEDIKIEFPRLAFVNYLPQIYRSGEQKDSFLSRFIAIYQTIYLDVESKIDNINMKLNPETTDTDFLDWLASWFSLKDRHIWSDEKLRELIPRLIMLYKIKGTKKSIKEIVKLYTGHEPIIIEKFEITENEYYRQSKRIIDKLYGDNGYTYTVLVNMKHLTSESGFLELLRLIRQFQPAEMILNLVALGEEIYLDQHSYLGMNTYLNASQSLILDEEHSGGSLYSIF